MFSDVNDYIHGCNKKTHRTHERLPRLMFNLLSLIYSIDGLWKYQRLLNDLLINFFEKASIFFNCKCSILHMTL